MGRQDDAVRHLVEARHLADRFDNVLLAAASRASLGTQFVAQGRLDEAWSALGEGMDLSVKADSIHCICLCLAGFARLRFSEGDAERAALVAGAVQGLRQRSGANAWPTLRSGEAEVVERIRQVLGPTRFDQAFTAGERLSRREAVAAARLQEGVGQR